MSNTMTIDASTPWATNLFQFTGISAGPQTSAPANAGTDGPAPPSDPMSLWRDWCAGFQIANGVGLALRTLILKGTIPVPAKLIKPLLAGLQGFNAALVDLDSAFNAYIKSGGTTPFQLDPPPINAWPAPGEAGSKSDLNYFESGFDILDGALTILSKKIEAKLATHPELQAVLAAVITLVNSEQDILNAMKPILQPATPPAV